MPQEARTTFEKLGVWLVGILVLAGLAAIGYTSGALPKDQQPLRISAQAGDTLVSIGAASCRIKGQSWPAPPAALSVQVAGWTASAACPTPNIDVGAPGYIYVDYNGRGLTTLMVGAGKLTYNHSSGKIDPLTSSE